MSTRQYSSNERKSLVQIRVSALEKAQIEASADAANQSVSEYGRSMMLAHTPRNVQAATTSLEKRLGAVDRAIAQARAALTTPPEE